MALEGKLTSICDKLVEHTIGQIQHRLQYLFRYTENIQNLKMEMEDLEGRRNNVQHLVAAAINNNEVIGTLWMEKVTTLNKEANQVIEAASTINSQPGWCLNLFHNISCRNLKSRYSLSRKAIKVAEEISRLKEEGAFGRVGYHSEPEQNEVGDLESRISLKEMIIECLLDKDTSIVCIYGMAGVGKTTLAKEILNQVKADKLFDEVVMATVSQDPDIMKIRDQLAEMMGLEINEKSNEVVRAGRLRHGLELNGDKSILVLLDDVWSELDLETIGIPQREGLKILFTTRKQDVWSNIGAHNKFLLNVLTREEARKLFKKAAEISDDTIITNGDVKDLVIKECRSLPLTLMTIGRALKYSRSEDEWRYALQKLRDSEIEKSVLSAIQFNYKFLENEEAQHLLLLCSLFPEDESIPVERLVIYARGLFKNTQSVTLSTTRDKVKMIVDKLKSCYLLLSGDEEDEVKMPNATRDFCLSIASQNGEHEFMIKHDLEEWPEQNEEVDESYTAMSLTFRKLYEQLPSGLKYRKLKLLRMNYRSRYSLATPSDFFEGMEELRVFEFTAGNENPGNYIPSSIELLTGLRSLCFEGWRVEHMPPIYSMPPLGSLNSLEILSFYESQLSGNFDELAMAKLHNLKSLDLRFKRGPRPIPPGVLQGMRRLEELYLGAYFGVDLKYIIDEVNSLVALSTFQIETDKTALLQELCFEKLQRFQVSLNFRDREFQLFEVFMFIPPERNSRFIESKEFLVERYLITHLIDISGIFPIDIFVNLELLYLVNLPNLIEICSGYALPGIQPLVFSKLKKLRVINCRTMRSVLPKSIAKGMVNLQSLEIQHCEMLEEIVSRRTIQADNETSTEIMFQLPNLKKLKLVKVTRFKSFISQSNHDAVGTRRTIWDQVLLPNLENLVIEEFNYPGGIMRGEEMQCDNMLTLARFGPTSLFQHLKLLLVVGWDAVQVLFDFEDLMVSKAPRTVVLGQIHRLELDRLPELVHIVRKVPEGIRVFRNLKSREVGRCDRLRCLFSLPMANSLMALELLSVTYCSGMEAIIGIDEEKSTQVLEHHETVQANETSNTRIMFLLPKLKALKLIDLNKFKSFISESDTVGTDQTIFDWVSLPNLEDLHIENLNILGEITLDKKMQITFVPMQRKLRVSSVHTMLALAHFISVRRLHRVKSLLVEECDAAKVLFDFDQDLTAVYNVNQMNIVLDQLNELNLYNLPKLVHIFRNVPKGVGWFYNLRSVAISSCRSLRYLFSLPMANSLMALECLSLKHCERIEEIIGIDEEESETLLQDGKARSTVFRFPRLRKLELFSLYNFRTFSSQKYDVELPSLDHLEIQHCPTMMNLCLGRLTAPELTQVSVVARVEGRERHDTVAISHFQDAQGSIKISSERISSYFREHRGNMQVTKVGFELPRW